MKHTVIKTWSLIFFLFSSFSVLAQNPEEAPEDVDGPTAPISDHLWILALIGSAYIFLKYQSKLAKVKS